MTPFLQASNNSSSDLLLPCKTILSPLRPPFKAVINSPSETASKPNPSEATILVSSKELFAFDAYKGKEGPG